MRYRSYPLTVVAGAELRMTLRRPALWLVLLGLALTIRLAPGAFNVGGWATGVEPGTAASWVALLNGVLPIAVGVLLADRLARDEALHLTELLDSGGVRPGPRVLGAFLGTVGGAAVVYLVPVLALSVEAAVRGRDPYEVLTGLGAYAAIVLPGLALVTACCLVCPLVMPVALFRALFVCYWGWGNLLIAGTFASPSASLLTPLGGIPGRAFFCESRWNGGDLDYPGCPTSVGWTGWSTEYALLPTVHASVSTAVASIVLLLAIAAMALIAGSLRLARRPAH